MHCQKTTFQSAAAVGSRVLVQVTDNQPSLVDALDNLPATIAPDEAFASSEKSRNRQEYRHVQVFHADGALDLPEWDEYALRAIRVYRKTWIKHTKTGGWDRRGGNSWGITHKTARAGGFFAAADPRPPGGGKNQQHVRGGGLPGGGRGVSVEPRTFA